MKLSAFLYAQPLDAVPVVKFSGKKKIPLIEFAGSDFTNMLLDQIDDLPAWLRAFATNLTAFADEVEARGQEVGAS